MHAAVVIDAFAHGEAVFAARQRHRPPHVEIVNRAARLAPDLEHVAEAFGRDECDARQLEMDLTEQRIRRDRAGMRELHDLRAVDLAQQRAQRVEQPFFGRFRRCRDLEAHDCAAIVGCNEIRERPADVHANTPAHRPRNARLISSLSASSRASPLATTRPVCST